MGEFFNPEKGIWAWLSTLVDICGLSILWTLLCLPAVTAGPATAALYYAVVKCVRRRESGAFGCFFRSFRTNFKVGLLAGLIVIPLGLALLGGYAVVRWYGTRLGAGPMCFMWPITSRWRFQRGSCAGSFPCWGGSTTALAVFSARPFS